MVRTIGVAFTVFLSLVTLTFDKGRAVEITQYFPAAATGEPAPRPQSGWKIKYEILKAGTHAYGGSAVWEFQSIAFMRGHTPSGEEDWINVLDRLAMAEMYVPYYDGLEIWDITGFSFNFVKASNDYIPRQGIISGKLLDDVLSPNWWMTMCDGWTTRAETKSGAAKCWSFGRRCRPAIIAMS